MLSFGLCFRLYIGKTMSSVIVPGSDAGFDKIRNVSFRGVRENTSHVLVVGEGAERLADKLGVEEVEEDWLITDYAR